MNFTLLNSLILAGAIQGFIFGLVVLFSKKYSSKSLYYLAALIIGFSYNNLQFYLADAGFITATQMYKTIYIPIGSLSAVFLLFYIITFLNPTKTITKKLKFLYLPFIIFLMNTIVYKVYSMVADLSTSVYQVFLSLNNIQSIFSFLFMLTVILISIFKTFQFEKRRKEYNPEQIQMHLNWLKITLVLLFLLTTLWGFALFKYLLNADYSFLFNLLWVGMSIVIYWLGHLGIYKFSILEERKQIRIYSKEQRNFSIRDKQKNEHITALEELLVTNKYYLDTNITLDLVAQNLNISKGHLSRVINAELNTSFTDYLNKLRVEEAMTYLQNPAFSNYTLVAIGLEAGFNSKSTFNLAFKKATGLTPSQFKKSRENSY